MSHRATYSPDDNKLRLYPEARLPKDEYDQVKAAGFRWAPKQELFVAPMWTPEREDMLLAMAGEIEDEDTSLVERAEERAERFGDYSASRRDEADAAHKAVDAICEHIPLGQPILVGHHSERRARRDAEKIENGMRKAIRLWDTAEYWKSRAAGALSHAKYKERPDVRARRIKGIEADQRKSERSKAEAEHGLRFWNGQCTHTDKATGEKKPFEIIEANREKICHLLGASSALHFYAVVKDGHYFSGWDVLRPDGDRYEACPSMTVAELQAVALGHYQRCIARADRWLAHYANRLAYERAMLAEDGGLAADGIQFEAGGTVNVRRWGWKTILRVNKRAGQVLSLTVTGCSWSIGLEEVLEYKAPSQERAEAVKKATATPPLCNYPGEGFLHQTRQEWESTVPKWSDFPKYVRVRSTETTGAHRVRNQRKPGGSAWDHVSVFITDLKRVDPPKKEAPPAPAPPPPAEPKPEPAAEPTPSAEPVAEGPRAQAEPGELFAEQPFNLVGQKGRATAEDLKARIEAMRASVQAGVKVVSAPNLFPTPPELAARMVELADIEPGQSILEPSAGTGNILKAIATGLCINDALGVKGSGVPVWAVEINPQLAEALRDRWQWVSVINRDFLDCNGDLGTFDRILMNPPFDHGSDIKHIEHALGFLKPGGRLVGLCANGTRQREAFQPIAEHWEDLPAGTFEGTGVCAALFVIKP